MTDREPTPIMIEPDGTKWWFFMYSYDWEGKTYAFDICARSKEEADARLKRLPLARFDGQGDGGRIKVNLLTRFAVPFAVWWRNVVHRITARARAVLKGGEG